jgi:hypothetical protein
MPPKRKNNPPIGNPSLPKVQKREIQKLFLLAIKELLQSMLTLMYGKVLMLIRLMRMMTMLIKSLSEFVKLMNELLW